MKRLTGTRQSHTLQITCLICIIKQVNLIIPTGTGRPNCSLRKNGTVKTVRRDTADVRPAYLCRDEKIGIISDTHGIFDTALKGFLADVDEIWHAGDIGSAALSDEIAAFKPLRAVYGNIDDAQTRRIWPETACFACEEITVLMTHIGGYPGRYEPSFLRRIESCRPGIVITGHSHILKVMYDRRHGALHINPGAAGKYGFHKVRTAIRLEVDGSAIGSLEVGEWKSRNQGRPSIIRVRRRLRAVSPAHRK